MADSDAFYLGRYHCLEKIGQGPLGETFRAKIYGVAGFQKQFAVKRLHERLARDPELVTRFVAFANRAAQLSYERIAAVHEVGVDGASYYVAVDLVRGVDLSRVLAGVRTRKERLPIDAALLLCDDLSSALDYAHRRVDLGPAGLLHLGLTPRSVMVTPDGEARILDFGLLAALARARWADDPLLLDTLPYLAPEVIEGVAVDARADVFSLGAVLYEMVAGRPAFGGGVAAEVRRRMVAGPAPVPGVDSRLLAVLYRALAPDPGARFPSVATLAEELRPLQTTRGARARTDLGGLARREVTVPPLGHAPRGAHLEDVPPRNTFAGVGPDDAVAPLVVLPGPATEKGMAAVLAEHFFNLGNAAEATAPAPGPPPAIATLPHIDEIEPPHDTTAMTAVARPTENLPVSPTPLKSSAATSQISAVTVVPRWGRVALSALGGAVAGVIILWGVLSLESSHAPKIDPPPLPTVSIAPTPASPTTALHSNDLPLDSAIDFVTEPPAALVFVDGVASGHAPIHIAMKRGPHRILILGEHCKLWQKTLEVADSQTLRIDLEPTRLVAPVAGPAGLKVRCRSQHQLRIFVDGVDTGVTCPNDDRIPVTIGPHRVGLYLPESDRVTDSEQQISGGNLSTRVYLDQ